MTDRYQPLRAALEKAAEEIAAAGHAGWGNVCREASDTIAALLKERDHLADECHEQARLLGMGGSRELALRTALQGLLDVLPVCPKNTGIEGIEEKYRNAVTAARGVLAGCRKQIGREEQ